MRKLVRNDPKLVNFWRIGEQVAAFGLLHQGCRDLAIEVRVASGFIIERVEDRRMKAVPFYQQRAGGASGRL